MILLSKIKYDKIMHPLTKKLKVKIIKISKEDKSYLLELTPNSYIGVAQELAKKN